MALAIRHRKWQNSHKTKRIKTLLATLQFASQFHRTPAHFAICTAGCATAAAIFKSNVMTYNCQRGARK